MEALEQLTVFRLDEQRFALPLASVERVVRAAEPTPLPQVPDVVVGLINVNGSLLPVLNVRRRFDLPQREIGADDHFLIARTARRRVVLAIDKAEGVVEIPLAEIVNSEQITPGIEQVRGVAKLDDGLVLIHDLESFLSLEEERLLDRAMKEETSAT